MQSIVLAAIKCDAEEKDDQKNKGVHYCGKKKNETSQEIKGIKYSEKNAAFGELREI